MDLFEEKHSCMFQFSTGDLMQLLWQLGDSQRLSMHTHLGGAASVLPLGFKGRMGADDGQVPMEVADGAVWTESNLVCVATDGSNAGLWQMNPDGSNLAEVAASKNGGVDHNPSGATTVSKFVRCKPLSMLLMATMNCGSSMAALTNPSCTGCL